MELTDLSKQRLEVFALHNKTENDVREDVQILRVWMSKLPHLPNEELTDNYLEICLLKNKFSIEKCKKKIETYCTMKANPQFGYLYERIPEPSKEASFHVSIPILTDDLKRVIVIKIFDTEKYEMVADCGLHLLLRELYSRYDYNDGEIQILDMRNCSVQLLKKFRVNVCVDSFKLVLGGYSARVSSIHMVSKIGKTLITSIQSFIPDKFLSRLTFHDDIDSLKDVVPAKYLPKDYGGDLKSLKDMIADWDPIFKGKNLELLKEFVDVKSHEELRMGQSSMNEEMNGTFKKLNID